MSVKEAYDTGRAHFDRYKKHHKKELLKEQLQQYILKIWTS